MAEPNLTHHHQSQIEKFKAELKKLKQRKSSFAWLRLGSIGAIIAAFYLLLNLGIIYVIIATIILLMVFIRLVWIDLNNHEKIKYNEKIIELYEKEQEALSGRFPFDSGLRYVDKEHPYSGDLDIFGDNSLFQYLNRTTSEPGADVLAGYLNGKAPLNIIYQRQAAVQELQTDEEWLKRLQTFGVLSPVANATSEKLHQWTREDNKFVPFKAWAWLRFLLPAIAVSAFFLFLNDNIKLEYLLIVLLGMSALWWRIDKSIAPIHRQLDQMAKQLGVLSHSIEMIENRKFSSPLAEEMRLRIFSPNNRASAEIRQIKKLLERLDLRYNMALSPFLNLFLLWNLQQMLGLEKWKLKNRHKIQQWTEVLAEFEALGSLANFSFNNPEYIFPIITDDYFFMEANELGHPLIDEKKRVNNPVSLPSKGRLLLVTGSNMAGKSTYLRSVGVNCILAFCGAPVCASSFKISLVDVVSSMRIADNLQESTSTFYAELKKLKVVIDKVNAGERVLILLDEILRGTNSHDRHTGSKALIKQLIEKESAGIIATHDLELAEMQDDFAVNLLNYHFDVQVSNEELYFDYKLKPGICRSMNASILMKKIGIEI